MADEEQLQKEWRHIVITKLNTIEHDQKQMQRDISESVIIVNEVKLLKEKVSSVEASLKERLISLEGTVKTNYVMKTEFNLIEKIVYGTVGVVLLSVLSAALFLIIKK